MNSNDIFNNNFDFSKYIMTHTIKNLTQGKSGASVCLLDNHKIAKYVVKSKLLKTENGNSVWDSCRREAAFYKAFCNEQKKACNFLPQIFYCNFDDKNVQLIMGEYTTLEKNKLTNEDFSSIMKLLSQVHNISIPEFLKEEKSSPLPLTDDELKNSVSGWKSIFDEHKAEQADDLDFSRIEKIASDINRLNDIFYSERFCLCHGDFHVENILFDKTTQNHVLCDWQSVKTGHPAEDIAFFMSRLQGDGIAFDENTLIDSYCNQTLNGITKDEIKTQMALANINTTFRFWHYYLHGSSIDFIKTITGKMFADYDKLMQRL